MPVCSISRDELEQAMEDGMVTIGNLARLSHPGQINAEGALEDGRTYWVDVEDRTTLAIQ